jgi:hypothetical protein
MIVNCALQGGAIPGLQGRACELTAAALAGNCVNRHATIAVVMVAWIGGLIRAGIAWCVG